jgi:hypothetical protein
MLDEPLTFEKLLNGKQVGWAPQPGSQQAFMSCPLFEVLYEGTRGPGKTDALLQDFAQHCGRGFGPAWKGILFRQTYPQLQDVISKSKKWFNTIFVGAKYNEAEHFWRWPTGEMLLFRQFQRDDDYWNYHGHEYPWIGWEELCNWATPVGFKRMMSCCRSSVPGVPKKLRATTNPYGPGHNWVKNRYRLPAWRGIVITDAKDDDGRPEPARIAIHGNIRENQVLLQADPEYIGRIRASARNKAELEAWLNGSWDIVAGGMFDDVWEPKVHVLPAFQIPHSWRIDRSFDYGSSKPFSVGWWAESDGSDVQLPSGKVMSTTRGDLFRIAEWYGSNGKPNEGLRMMAGDIARGIVEKELRMGLFGRVKAGVADSSIFDVENGHGIAQDMQQPVRLEDGKTYPGVMWLPADKRPGSRKQGWEAMRKMLKDAKRPMLKTRDGKEVPGPRERPGLFVFSNCDHFQRTVPVLPRSDKDQDDVNSDAEDHIADEVRYRVRFSQSRPKAGRSIGV